MALPLASVAPPFRGTSVAKLLLVRSANVTIWPWTGLPEPSVTIALMTVLFPADRDVESAVKVMMSPVDVAEELDNLVKIPVADTPVTLA